MQLNEPRGAAGLPEIRQAYEFSLDRLGQDSASGGLWQDYLAFLQAPKQGSPEYAAVYGEALEGQVRLWRCGCGWAGCVSWCVWGKFRVWLGWRLWAAG